jgi:hypothetical protein
LHIQLDFNPGVGPSEARRQNSIWAIFSQDIVRFGNGRTFLDTCFGKQIKPRALYGLIFSTIIGYQFTMV